MNLKFLAKLLTAESLVIAIWLGYKGLPTAAMGWIVIANVWAAACAVICTLEPQRNCPTSEPPECGERH